MKAILVIDVPPSCTKCNLACKTSPSALMCGVSEQPGDYKNAVSGYKEFRAPFCPLKFVPSVYMHVLDKITEAGTEVANE